MTAQHDRAKEIAATLRRVADGEAAMLNHGRPAGNGEIRNQRSDMLAELAEIVADMASPARQLGFGGMI